MIECAKEIHLQKPVDPNLCLSFAFPLLLLLIFCTTYKTTFRVTRTLLRESVDVFIKQHHHHHHTKFHQQFKLEFDSFLIGDWLANLRATKVLLCCDFRHNSIA